MRRETIEEWGIPALTDAYDELERISEDPELRELYEAKLKFVRDQTSIIYTQIHEARETGLKQGLEQGIEQEKRNNARRLLAKGLEARFVAEALELDLAEVEAMQDQRGES